MGTRKKNLSRSPATPRHRGSRLPAAGHSQATGTATAGLRGPLGGSEGDSPRPPPPSQPRGPPPRSPAEARPCRGLHRGLPREHPPSIPAAGGRRSRAEPCRAVQSRVEPSRAVTHPPGPSGETPASVAERMCRGSQPPLLAPSPRCLPASRPSSLLCLLPSFPPRPPARRRLLSLPAGC